MKPDNLVKFLSFYEIQNIVLNRCEQLIVYLFVQNMWYFSQNYLNKNHHF